MNQRFDGSIRARFAPAARRLVPGLLVLALLPNTAGSVEDRMAGTLRIRHVFSIGQPEHFPGAVEVSEYSNISNFSGQVLANGGAEVQGPNTITRVVADDIQPAGLAAGQDVTRFSFTVANLTGTYVVCRARVRIWYDSGAGTPGPFYDQSIPIGLTFNPLSFPPGVVLVEAPITSGVFKMPAGTFWAGVTFDNAEGTTTAQAAELDRMGQAMFSPADIGASSAAAFITDQAGSFYDVNYPTGSRFDFGDGPPASFGWEFYAISATPTVTSSWGRIKNLYR